MDQLLSSANSSVEISAAARALGSRTKQLFGNRRSERRVWTGFIQGKRCWKGRTVILPDGNVGRIKSVRRGNAIVLVTEQKESVKTTIDKSFPAVSLRIWKDPAAVALGRRKRGRIERKSPKKLLSCQLNAAKPTRFGSKRRGRPRKSGPTKYQFHLKCRDMPQQEFSVDALLMRVVREEAEYQRILLARRQRQDDRGS